MIYQNWLDAYLLLNVEWALSSSPFSGILIKILLCEKFASGCWQIPVPLLYLSWSGERNNETISRLSCWTFIFSLSPTLSWSISFSETMPKWTDAGDLSFTSSVLLLHCCINFWCFIPPMIDNKLLFLLIFTHIHIHTHFIKHLPHRFVVAKFTYITRTYSPILLQELYILWPVDQCWQVQYISCQLESYKNRTAFSVNYTK